MQKVLIAVDDSKGSLKTIDTFLDIFSNNPQQKVVLLYVEKIQGRSLMDEMLGEAELSTLKEELKNTEHQEKLDKKAGIILTYFRKPLESKGITDIKDIVKEGHPADEIIATAKEEGAGLIIVGSRSKRMHTLLMGSVSREIANRADISVLIAR